MTGFGGYPGRLRDFEKTQQQQMEASLIRGGTSRGVFFVENGFPFKRGSRERDDFVRKIFGVPDPSGMEIDGLGGGISSTSKVVFVNRSMRSGFDLDYDFGTTI